MEPEQKSKHEVVETYAGDMAKVIGSSKEEGLVKKIIAQEEEFETKKGKLTPELRKNKFFILGGILLLFMAFAILSFFFFFKKEINTVQVEKQFTSLFFIDKSISLEISGMTKDEIAKTVFGEVNGTKVKSKGIEGIYPTENQKIIGLRRFISLIKGNFIPGNNTLFVNDGFLVGVMNNDTKDFFILLKVRSVADVFERLRAWENKMFFDLHGFFGVDISPDTGYLLTKNFEDGVIGNKNARILYRNDNEGDSAAITLQTGRKIAIMYIFADENSVIIANTENVAREIILRLAGSQTKQ